MNEIMKRFIAESTISQGHPQIDGTFFDKEKFAELIVRECAEVAGCNGHVSGFTLGDLIKLHFGVE